MTSTGMGRSALKDTEGKAYFEMGSIASAKEMRKRLMTHRAAGNPAET
jgi:hypothetical protein